MAQFSLSDLYGYFRFLRIPLIVFGLLYTLTDTRIGVHAVFEVINFVSPDEHPQYMPTNPAVPETATLKPVGIIDLPDSVEQPSGLSVGEDEKQLFLVTDQAELFELKGDTLTVASRVLMKNVPLVFRQGTIETVAIGAGKVFVSGDGGTIQVWKKLGVHWHHQKDIVPSGPDAAQVTSLSAMTYDENSRMLHFGTETGVLGAIDTRTGEVSILVLKGANKPERSLRDLEFVGMDIRDGRLFVLTATIPSILEVDLATGWINNLYLIAGNSDPAGLALVNNMALVLQDHEYTEPSPGIKAYQIPSLREGGTGS
ncbi:hypothetical protein [Epibacterium ulvae]|uniref:hypothetical protein n=1 Tax=Epibacterium ulvae TaxID=1156985 RepID=UPI002492840C|nr:hypothetical protein [Epibacterium ulvae]